MLAFNAATGNALTTVLAGFAFTSVSLPKMILLVALVAGFLRVLILARPGMVNTPVFFASAAPISQVTQELGDNTLLQLGASCKALCKGTFGHGLCRGCFHPPWSHAH